jgi:hypothetical protein
MTLEPLMWSFGAAPTVLVLAVYSRLPGRVVMHWDLHGNPTHFAPRRAFLVLTLIAPLTAWMFLMGPAREAVHVQPVFLYLDAAILALVAVTLIVATLLNLRRRTG